jgi:hypothetical protein
MPDLRQSWLVARINADIVLLYLAGMADHLEAAKDCDLRLVPMQNGDVQVVMPHFDAAPHRPKDEVLALRQAAWLCATKVLESEPLKKDPVSRNFDEAEPIEVAIWHAVARRLHPAPPLPKGAQPLRKLAVVRGADDAALRAVADFVRRGRHVALTVGQDQTEPVTVLAVDDDAAQGATIQGLRAANPDLSYATYAPVQTTLSRLWLPDDRDLLPDDIAATGAILRGMATAGWIAADEELALISSPGPVDGQMRVQLCRMKFAVDAAPMQPAVEVVSDLDMGRRIEFAHITIAPKADAAAALAEKVAAKNLRVGYRVALRPFPEYALDQLDIERLTDEITERQAMIDEVRAYHAPQMCLLRFNDDQVPALVDGLRRLPLPMLRNAGLLYCAAHAAERAMPAHFLLYDPAKVSLDGRLPEHYWRSQTSDHPISYWLDPHSATALRGDPGEPLIFVPSRQHISPPVASFGGTLGQTMRLVLGNLFADAEKMLARAGAKPMFVFSPAEAAWADLGLELLDMQDFQPVSLSLKWLNDHIIVRSPEIADRADLEAMAEALYRGDVAKRLAGTAQNAVERLDHEWQEAIAVINARFDAVTRRLTEDMEQVAGRVALSAEFATAARQRLRFVDDAVRAFERVLSGAAAVESSFVSEDHLQRQAQASFTSSLSEALSTSEQLAERARADIAREIERIERLAQELEGRR